MSRRGRVTLADGLTIWQAREVYRVQSVLLALFYFPQAIFAFLAVGYVLRAAWGPALMMVLALALLWGARWVLCTGLPWALRWGWRQVRVGVATRHRKENQ
ncbi:MAG TPA: hypothetical protein VI542_00460 [Candidatus Tectomicrobia bacterium]